MTSARLPVALAFCLATPIPLFAADAEKGAPVAPAKTQGAEAAWSEIEKSIRGPAERPKSRDEAIAMMKAHIAKLDEMVAEFTKAYPTDPRRWKAALAVVDTYRIREVVGLPAKSLADAKASLSEIVAAPDADSDVRANASFLSINATSEEMKAGKATFSDLEKAVEAHQKAFPDFKNNAQLTQLLSAARSDVDIKTKPIELKFAAVDGREVDLEKLRGKVVLVDFWATWCGPCIAEIPNVLKTYGKLHEKGFEIIGISFDQEKEKLEALTKEKGMTWPQYFDGKGWKNDYGQKFGINSIPRMWLVNKKGMVADTNGREDLEGKVEKLLAE
jgi:thiol-disulfide isomerase/thioredoxin